MISKEREVHHFLLTAVYFEKGEGSFVCQDALVLECVKRGNQELIMAVVCDGIGGLKQGEFASGYVTGQLKKWFYQDYLKKIGPWFTKKKQRDSITRKLHQINRELLVYARQEEIALGTTLTMMLLHQNRYQLFHVGDSRAYLFPGTKQGISGVIQAARNGKKSWRLTTDDVYERNVLCKCIGSFGWQGIEIRQGKIPRNGTIFLCTDGLTKKVRDSEWQSLLNGVVIETDRQLEKRIEKLAKEARKRGEKDDQTGIVIINR